MAWLSSSSVKTMLGIPTGITRYDDAITETVSATEQILIDELNITGITTTSEDDFIFFINGQYMEHDALTVQQSGSYFYLKVNTTSIGYNLESDDEIIAWGKFNS